MAHEWIDTIVSTLGYRRPQRIPDKRPQQADVTRLEVAIGGALPETYRYFLERWGGGYFSHRTCFAEAPIAEPCPGGDTVTPELWYPLGVECDDSIENMTETYRGRIPNGVLPCADDAFGNQLCIDIAGSFPGSVWFWDHEQHWFAEQSSEQYPESLHSATRELEHAGADTSSFSIHDVIRAWARLHAARWDRPPDYMGMYRMADSFKDFLLSLRSIRYDSIPNDSE
jgi:SMI1 / KNR4 family (SUKH-1)